MLPRIPPAPAALQQADSTLQPLMQSVRAAVFASPLDQRAVKASLVALLEYLSSPTGRTDTNCCAVDTFFYLDDDLPLKAYQIRYTMFIAHMDALHDTITAPDIAEKFTSTPEQLLERVRN